MVQYLHDSVIHTNVLRFNPTCQLTVLNFSQSVTQILVGHKLCCVVAVVLNMKCAPTQRDLWPNQNMCN